MEVTGVLFKRRGGFGKHMPGAWTKRYFTLDKGMLEYYNDVDDEQVGKGEPRNVLDMAREECTVDCKTHVEGAPTNFTISIVPADSNKEKWRLCAENADEMAKWTRAFRPFDNTGAGGVSSASTGGATPGSPARADTSGSSSPQPKILSSPLPPLSAAKRANSSASAAKRQSRRASTKGASAALRDRLRRATGDHYEGALVLILMNLCFMFGTVDLVQHNYVFVLSFVGINLPFIAPDLSVVSVKYMVYVGLANMVVARTLYLRALRVVKAVDTAGFETLASMGNAGSPSGKGRRLSDASSVYAPSDAGSAMPSPLPAMTTNENGKCPIGVTFDESYDMAPNAPDHSWSRCDHRHFKVRQKGYASTKQKASSEAPMYEVVDMDCFYTDKRKDHIARFMDLPDIKAIREKLAQAPGKAKFVPPLFVFQLQLPVEAPSMFSAKKEDGPGWAMCVYFKLSDWALEALLKGEEDSIAPGLRCFSRWCENYSTNQDWKKRVKLIASCLNLDEMGVSSWVQSFNAKPVLIRRTSTIFRDEELSYLELDIHVQKFDAVAQQSIVSMTSRAGEMYMEIGILIESQLEDELPELLVGCVGCNKPKEEELKPIGIDDDEFCDE